MKNFWAKKRTRKYSDEEDLLNAEQNKITIVNVIAFFICVAIFITIAQHIELFNLQSTLRAEHSHYFMINKAKRGLLRNSHKVPQLVSGTFSIRTENVAWNTILLVINGLKI